jgi:hypothetical protein
MGRPLLERRLKSHKIACISRAMPARFPLHVIGNKTLSGSELRVVIEAVVVQNELHSLPVGR